MAHSLLQTSTVQKTHLEYKSELRDKLHNNKSRRNYAQAKKLLARRETERERERKKNWSQTCRSKTVVVVVVVFEDRDGECNQ
jgi:hypothetical protein